MDPKAQANLDPKLKEMYDRIMAVNIPSSAAKPTPTPAPQASPPTPTPTPPPNPISNVAVVPQMATTQATIATSFAPQAQAKPAPQKTSTSFVATVPKKNSTKLTPLLIAIGVILFFAVYTVMWIKIFNVPLPFLP